MLRMGGVALRSLMAWSPCRDLLLCCLVMPLLVVQSAESGFVVPIRARGHLMTLCPPCDQFPRRTLCWHIPRNAAICQERP